MEKNELRKEIRSRKRQFSAEELRVQSLSLISRLLVHPRIEQANTVMLYHSLPDEVDTHTAIDRLAACGKRVLLPVVLDEERMEVREYRDQACLQTGSMNILEPMGRPFQTLEEIDVIVVPGMSFDADGHRLGRGKGYYDRFLQQVPKAYKMGICFDFQKVDYVPSDQYDIPMNEVI